MKFYCLNNDLDDIVDGTTTVSKSTNSSTAVYSKNAGTASKATNADTSNYSKNSGTAVYTTNAGTSNYSKNSGTATRATNAGTSTYATNAGTSNYSKNFTITNLTPTANTSYVTIDSATNHSYQIGKLVIVNVNIKIIKAVSSSTTLLSGLPACKYAAGACINATNNQAKIRISTDIGSGKVIYADGANSTTGWYSGQLIYITS